MPVHRRFLDDGVHAAGGPILTGPRGGARAWALLLLCAAGACGAEPRDAGAGELAPFACELGTVESGQPPGAGASFAPLAEGSRAELVAGFQGFLWFVLHARALEPPPAESDALVRLRVGDAEPIDLTQPRVRFAGAAAGALSSELQLFLDPPASAVSGRHAEVSVRLRGGGLECAASGAVLLVDDDPCLHTGAEPLCPEDAAAR